MKDKQINLTAVAETKAAEGEDRTLTVTISTSTPDRSGDIVVPSGGDLRHFKKNPVVLFGHNYSQPPIAKASSLKVGDKEITAKVNFPEKGLYPFADTIYDLYQKGIMNAWSIGFIPKAAEPLDPEKPWGAQRFDKWEMLEFSAVPVPANPEALTQLRSLDIDDTTIRHLTAEAPEEKEVEEAEVEVETDEKETEEEKPEVLEGTGLSYDSATKRLTITHEKGSIGYTITEDQLNTFSAAAIATEETEAKEAQDLAEMKAEDLTKTLTALRDALKPADKGIGLALRNLKSLLDQPNPEGGE